jgi:hypothetical protein
VCAWQVQGKWGQMVHSLLWLPPAVVLCILSNDGGQQGGALV